ncbi:hypothetical protein WP50_36430 [Lactiplantibacillus plantarum]|nr:hypothetical protein WP50_36430 [Lactiplantibacillus plantarum]
MTTNLFEDVVVRTTKFGDLPVLHVFAASQAQTKLPTISLGLKMVKKLVDMLTNSVRPKSKLKIS